MAPPQGLLRLLRLLRLPLQRPKPRRKALRRQSPRLLRNPLRRRPPARHAPQLHRPRLVHRHRRSGPAAKKFAALRSSAALRAKTTSISRKFPAPAPAAASVSTTSVPPSKAVVLHAPRRVRPQPPSVRPRLR